MEEFGGEGWEKAYVGKGIYGKRHTWEKAYMVKGIPHGLYNEKDILSI